MPTDRIAPLLTEHVRKLEEASTAKGAEKVVVAVKPAAESIGLYTWS